MGERQPLSARHVGSASVNASTKRERAQVEQNNLNREDHVYTKFVNEEEIRTIGPALVIVLELEAPPRFFSLASTDQEFEHLLRWLSTDARAAEIADAYFEQERPDELMRTRLHAYRLGEGERLGVGERVLSRR
jgi:hypothetical protein